MHDKCYIIVLHTIKNNVVIILSLGYTKKPYNKINTLHYVIRPRNIVQKMVHSRTIQVKENVSKKINKTMKFANFYKVGS